MLARLQRPAGTAKADLLDRGFATGGRRLYPAVVLSGRERRRPVQGRPGTLAAQYLPYLDAPFPAYYVSQSTRTIPSLSQAGAPHVQCQSRLQPGWSLLNQCPGTRKRLIRKRASSVR